MHQIICGLTFLLNQKVEKFSVIVSIEPTLPLYLTSVLGSLKFLAQVLSYLPLAAVYQALPPRHALCMKDVILFDVEYCS